MSHSAATAVACRSGARRPPAVSGLSGCKLAALSVALAAGSAAALAAGSVSVRLEADVLPQCAVGIGGADGGVIGMDAGDIAVPGSRELGFALSCNAPFSYNLEARNGALTHDGAGAAVPYTVIVRIATDGAAIEDQCPGDSLLAGHVRCQFTHSGNAVAADAAGRLTVIWRPPPTAPPAGRYSERLTLTLSTRY